MSSCVVFTYLLRFSGSLSLTLWIQLGKALFFGPCSKVLKLSSVWTPAPGYKAEKVWQSNQASTLSFPTLDQKPRTNQKIQAKLRFCIATRQRAHKPTQKYPKALNLSKLSNPRPETLLVFVLLYPISPTKWNYSRGGSVLPWVWNNISFPTSQGRKGVAKQPGITRTPSTTCPTALHLLSKR